MHVDKLENCYLEINNIGEIGVGMTIYSGVLGYL